PPTSWTSGQTQTYSISVTNTGTQTWAAGGTTPVRLGVHFGTADRAGGGRVGNEQRFGLPTDLAPGASVTLSVDVTAPTTAGNFILRHRMMKEGVAWFDQIQKTNVVVSGASALAAGYTSSPPTSWTSGQTQTYSISVTNTGTQTWAAGGTTPVRLGVHFGTAD